MAKQIVFLALIFFAVVGMAAADNSTTTPSAGVPVFGEDAAGGDHPIGPVTGGPAPDAAPVGGPVPENAFPKLAPAPGAPPSSAAVHQVTAAAGAIVAAGVVGSFFF